MARYSTMQQADRRRDVLDATDGRVYAHIAHDALLMI
jgi:hypothetical protein